MGGKFGELESKGLMLLSRETERFLQATLAHRTAWNPFPKPTDTAQIAIQHIKSFYQEHFCLPSCQTVAI